MEYEGKTWEVVHERWCATWAADALILVREEDDIFGKLKGIVVSRSLNSELQTRSQIFNHDSKDWIVAQAQRSIPKDRANNDPTMEIVGDRVVRY